MHEKKIRKNSEKSGSARINYTNICMRFFIDRAANISVFVGISINPFLYGLPHTKAQGYRKVRVTG
jgi:hypothetical protein